MLLKLLGNDVVLLGGFWELLHKHAQHGAGIDFLGLRGLLSVAWLGLLHFEKFGRLQHALKIEFSAIHSLNSSLVLCMLRLGFCQGFCFLAKKRLL